MQDPPNNIDYSDQLDRIHGSMMGMALGDALGASVEFRPRAFMVANPMETLKGGGTWGRRKGTGKSQFNGTSCPSLITMHLQQTSVEIKV